MINDLLVGVARDIGGRSATPSAGVLDNQSVICGCDVGKKVNGRALLHKSSAGIHVVHPA
jgi:hypothetical protein